MAETSNGRVQRVCCSRGRNPNGIGFLVIYFEAVEEEAFSWIVPVAMNTTDTRFRKWRHHLREPQLIACKARYLLQLYPTFRKLLSNPKAAQSSRSVSSKHKSSLNVPSPRMERHALVAILQRWNCSETQFCESDALLCKFHNNSIPSCLTDMRLFHLEIHWQTDWLTNYELWSFGLWPLTTRQRGVIKQRNNPVVSSQKPKISQRHGAQSFLRS